MDSDDVLKANLISTPSRHRGSGGVIINNKKITLLIVKAFSNQARNQETHSKSNGPQWGCWSSSLLTRPGGKRKGPEHSSSSLQANYHLQMFPPRGGKPWCYKSPPSTFTARKDFFSVRRFSTTSGCQFICSTTKS